jgi:hypothetical protein
VAALTSAANIPHQIKLWQNKTLRIFWTDTQFHWMIPSFAHFTATLKLMKAWNWDYRMKLGLKDRVTLRITFNTLYLCDLLIAYTLGSPEICVPLQLAGDSGTKIGKRTALLGCKIKKVGTSPNEQSFCPQPTTTTNLARVNQQLPSHHPWEACFILISWGCITSPTFFVWQWANLIGPWPKKKGWNHWGSPTLKILWKDGVPPPLAYLYRWEGEDFGQNIWD